MLAGLDEGDAPRLLYRRAIHRAATEFMTARNDPGRQPLSSSVYCILLVLAEEERHGYAIKQRVEELTGGDVTLGAGTLYGALSRLLGLELIAERDRPTREQSDDERRRYYR